MQELPEVEPSFVFVVGGGTASEIPSADLTALSDAFASMIRDAIWIEPLMIHVGDDVEELTSSPPLDATVEAL